MRRGQPFERIFCFTETGYLNGALFAKIMDLFGDLWRTLYEGINCLLIGDNLEIHRQDGVIKTAKQKGVHMFFLPPNTTHFLQPLDDLVFAVYKNQLRDFAGKLNRALSSSTSKLSREASSIVSIAANFAEESAFQPSVVRKSWEHTLLPFDSQKIIENARLNIGLETHSNEPRKLTDITKFAEDAVVGMMHRHQEVVSHAKRSNRQVTLSYNYGELYDTDSILKKAEEERLHREAKERLKQDQEAEKAQKQEERQKIAEEKKTRKEEEEARKEEKKQAKMKERQKRRREKEEAAAMRKRARIEKGKEVEGRRCKVAGCRTVYYAKSDPKFQWCWYCDYFGICPTHSKEKRNRDMLKAHESDCTGNPLEKENSGE